MTERSASRTGSGSRALSLAAAALVLGACSTMDCDDPTRYIGAELHKPIEVPAGLDPVVTSDNYKVPGGAPPKDYPGGACLMKPPQLVNPQPEPPKAAPEPTGAPTAAPADGPAEGAPATPPTGG